MKKSLILLLFMLVGNLALTYIVINMIPIPIGNFDTYYEDEYSLIIDEGDELEVQWQYKTLNQSLINKLTNETNLNLDLSSYNQSDIFVWIITMTEDNENDCDADDLDYWEVLRDEYKSIHDDENYIASHKYRIHKSPRNYMRSMIKMENYFTNRLIPIEIHDFLDTVEIHLESSSTLFSNISEKYEVESNSIIKRLANKTEFMETLSYNEDGILKSDIIYYENHTVMAIELVDYEITRYDPPEPNMYYYLIYRILILMIINTFISIIIVTIAISPSYDEHIKSSIMPLNSHRSNHNPSDKDESRNYRKSRPFEISGKIIENQSNNKICFNCSTPLNNNAIFCSNCGLKINSEIQYCQDCGRVNQKTANYCHECGHKF
jgi:hypothetical protein